MNRWTVACLLIVVLGFPGVSVAAPRSFPQPALFGEFSDPSRPGMFQVGIRWGEVRIHGHDLSDVRIEPTIEVDANIASRLTEAEILERISLRLVERANVIEAVVESTLDGFYSVDLDVWLPRETSTSVEVRDGGNITVDDLDGEVEISNLNGSVDLSRLSGAAVVHARNGSITATFRSIAKDLPMSFSTLNGSVDVTFPEPPRADVRIRYNRGGVESDFAIASMTGDVEADTKGLDPRATRVLEGRIAGGGPRYYFHTANGTVYLRRQ